MVNRVRNRDREEGRHMANALVDKFNQGIPGWFGDVKQRAADKIRHLDLIRMCAQGDESAIRSLVLGFWPFVDGFPNHIERATWALVRGRLLSSAQKRDLPQLMESVRGLLPGIREEEENHRLLWIRTAEAIGISKEELQDYGDVSTGMQSLIALTSAPAHPTTKLLQFCTVEIVAESLSQTLLASESFKAKAGKRGLGWFQVHGHHHAEDTHETLTLRLALALNTEDAALRCEEVVKTTADAFVDAANACVNAASRDRRTRCESTIDRSLGAFGRKNV